MTQPRPAFDGTVSSHLTVAPSPFLEARETSALAAVATAPTKARKAAELLRLIDAAGRAGMSDPEIHAATRWPRSTICSIRNSVRIFLWPADRRAVSEWGIECTCWRRASEAEVTLNRQRRKRVNNEGGV